MEFANVNYINVEGEAFLKDNCDFVHKYADLKILSPIIVDDFLKLHPIEENIALFTSYIEKNFLLVPMRRKPLVKQKSQSNFPRRVLLEITSQCNLKCTMCPRNVLKRPQIHMPKDAVLKCIDEIDNYGVEGLWLYNIGESFLHPNFKEIFTYCQNKKNLGSVWLSTNGQIITDGDMDMLINSNLTFLNYSLNAMTAENYKLISPEGNYERLVYNLDKLLEKKKSFNRVGVPPWVRIQMIEQPQVFSEIDLFFTDYAQRAEIISINMLEAFSQNVTQNISYAKTRQHQLQKRCNRIQREDCFIFSDGEVAFCDTDFNHGMSIGSIYNSTIEQIWNGSKRRNYELLNKDSRLDEVEMCRDCLDYDL